MNLTHRNRIGYFRLGCLKYPPLRSPLSGGEGLCCAFILLNLRTRRRKEPSPLERGDRSGAKVTELRGDLRVAIAVGEIHHTVAPSRLVTKRGCLIKIA